MATPTLDQLKNDTTLGYYTAHILAILASGKNPDGTDWGMRTKEPLLTPIAGSQFGLAVTSSTGLTVPSGAKYAWIQPLGQNVRYRDDGSAPTSSVGFQLSTGTFFLYSGDLSAIRFIQEQATATLNVAYYS